MRYCSACFAKSGPHPNPTPVCKVPPATMQPHGFDLAMQARRSRAVQVGLSPQFEQ